MKVLCPQCERLAELERFRVDAGQLFVTCARCGVEVAAVQQQAATSLAEGSPASTVAAPAPATPLVSPPRPASQPPRVSLTSSPAASNVVMLRTATVESVERAAQAANGSPFDVPEGFCPKCIARRDGRPTCAQCGVRFATFRPSEVAPPRWLEEAWVALLRDWGNDAQHERLRGRAQREDALTALGRLYRLRLAVEPNDPIAERGRTDLLRVAASAMSFRAAGERGGSNRLKVALTALTLLLCAAAMILLVRSMMTQVP